MTRQALDDERRHLAQLLEAVQRSAFYLHATASKIDWPLRGPVLEGRQKDVDLFESLAAFNERFAKLQDTLGATMRHAALLMSEPASPFLRVLSLFEKLGVIDSIEAWQLVRTARNLAAHDYETDYELIAQHFNELESLRPALVLAGARLIDLCATALAVRPASEAFVAEFEAVVAALRLRR